MPFIDTHCHLDSILAKLGTPAYADFKARFLPADYAGCITISCDPAAIEPTLALLAIPEVYGAFGIHPHDAKAYDEALEARLRAALAHPKAVAWGEIGLDYHYDFSPRETQREAFARQIRQGVGLGKPLIVHTREAEADTLAILEAEAPRDWRIHVHCFTSSPAMAERLLAHFPNLCLGLTGIVTFRNAQELQAVARATPLDRLLLETDGPYLAPIPHRGQPAHPGHIPLIAAKIAELKGIAVEAVYGAARENTRKVYGI
jgi:TatD DNase family protein